MSHAPPADLVRLFDLSEFDVLGEGTHGVVFRTVEKDVVDDPQEVAVKELKNPYDESITLEDSLLRKVAGWKKVRLAGSRYVVSYRYLFRAPPWLTVSLHNAPFTYYLVTEYISPYTIDTMVRTTRADDRLLPHYQRAFLNLLRTALAGLHFLHSINIAHRDLKPTNIAIRHPHSEQPESVLIDLGLSCFAEKENTQCEENPTEGTPVYRSIYAYFPAEASATANRAKGFADPLKLNDVWALGVSFFEALWGELFWEFVERLRLAMPFAGAAEEPILRLFTDREFAIRYNSAMRTRFSSLPMHPLVAVILLRILLIRVDEGGIFFPASGKTPFWIYPVAESMKTLIGVVSQRQSSDFIFDFD